MKTWRVCSSRYKAKALNGQGAFLYGGRWNSAGKRAIYTGPSVAAAVLEILVHAGSLTQKYVAIQLEVPSRLVTELDMKGAPTDWQRRSHWCQKQGDDWFNDPKSSLGLIVPSAVLGTGIPERNLVLNVDHKDFSKVRSLAKPLDLWLDERLGPP